MPARTLSPGASSALGRWPHPSRDPVPKAPQDLLAPLPCDRLSSSRGDSKNGANLPGDLLFTPFRKRFLNEEMWWHLPGEALELGAGRSPSRSSFRLGSGRQPAAADRSPPGWVSPTTVTATSLGRRTGADAEAGGWTAGAGQRGRGLVVGGAASPGSPLRLACGRQKATCRGTG